jgi:4-hydroxy-tetrahydrodipicolinate synthase
MNPNVLKGMFPATILPMDADYRPNYEVFAQYLEWLIGENAAGFAINMDTGEGPALAIEEKRHVAETAVNVASGRVKVLAGVMGSTTQDAVSLAKMYREIGVDGLVVFPNPAFRNFPLDPHIPICYHQAIAEESGLAIVLFQLASVFGGVIFPEEVLIALLKLPQVIGLKEASFDAQVYSNTAAIVRTMEKPITLMTGNDTFIFESILLGAQGGLLGFGAIGCQIVASLLADAARGDLKKAFDTHQKAKALMQVIYQNPVLDYRARCKVALAHIGVIPKALTFVRPPLLQIAEEESEQIKAALDGSGMF